jgi:RNA recognition motif-containing protein
MNIYVGNLSYEVTEDQLMEEFTAFGEVSSLNIIKDKYSGQSKGFAFVEMPSLQEGQAAINGLNGKIVDNRALTVNGARPRGEGGGGGGGRSFGGGGRSHGGGGGRGGYGGGGRGKQRRY